VGWATGFKGRCGGQRDAGPGEAARRRGIGSPFCEGDWGDLGLG